jgi:hypothetical protein
LGCCEEERENEGQGEGEEDKREGQGAQGSLQDASSSSVGGSRRLRRSGQDRARRCLPVQGGRRQWQKLPITPWVLGFFPGRVKTEIKPLDFGILQPFEDLKITQKFM